MRPPTELLAELTHRSITLTVATDRLQVAAPTGAMTAELRAEIAAQKPALLALLAQPRPTPASTSTAPRKDGQERVRIEFAEVDLAAVVAGYDGMPPRGLLLIPAFLGNSKIYWSKAVDLFHKYPYT